MSLGTGIFRWRTMVSAAAAVAASLLGAITGPVQAADDVWPSLQKEIFNGRKIAAAGPLFSLFVPAQAADAALVPVSIRLPDAVARKSKALTLLIDRNPAPVAAAFEFADGFRGGPDIGERLIETRIRIDSFSQVRAVLELTDGTLHVASKFVAGAGGCSAPSSKDTDAALAGLGAIRIDMLRNPVRGEPWRDLRVMIRHPNFTGMQMSAATSTYVPARFVDTLEVSRDGVLALRMTGGISLSENPHLRLSFGSSQASETIAVTATDSAGARFAASSVADGS
ncbi:MAG: quinoprotein dehydrogenase-associated SoxYZ-like carrier [Hyphomicrobiaceae bacterium]|nr:quinoprotein dehydrogenase-associated SoxYZ-like carrier [Hyphomicrobiaceae bacterium]